MEAASRLLHVSVGTVQINRQTIRRTDDPRLLFELRPGAVAHAEVDYRVNGLGLRGPQTTLEKAAGVRRIAQKVGEEGVGDGAVRRGGAHGYRRG